MSADAAARPSLGLAAADELAVSPSERLVSAAARRLAGTRSVFVGIGLPNMAAAVARATLAPDLELVYESGVVGAVPDRLALSVGDPWLVSGAAAVLGMHELFAYVLQGGHIDVALLGAAQIDPTGALNTTVIGDYQLPHVRLPGSGGACDIALNARECFVIMRQSRRSFVPRLDFCTSPSPARRGLVSDDPLRRYGRGVTRVITDLAEYDLGGPGGILRLLQWHHGVTIDAVQRASGFDIALHPDAAQAPPVPVADLTLMREVVDPDGVYLKP